MSVEIIVCFSVMKEVDQVKALIYLGTIIIWDMRFNREVKTRVAVNGEEFNRRRRLLSGPWGWIDNWGKTGELFVWRVVLYGAETWALRKEDEEELELLRYCCCCKIMKGIKLVRRVKNEEILRRVLEMRHIKNNQDEEILLEIGLDIAWEDYVYIGGCYMEGILNRGSRKGRRRYQMVNGVKRVDNYEKTKSVEGDRMAWKAAIWRPTLGMNTLLLLSAIYEVIKYD